MMWVPMNDCAFVWIFKWYYLHNAFLDLILMMLSYSPSIPFFTAFIHVLCGLVITIEDWLVSLVDLKEKADLFHNNRPWSTQLVL